MCSSIGREGSAGPRALEAGWKLSLSVCEGGTGGQGFTPRPGLQQGLRESASFRHQSPCPEGTLLALSQAETLSLGAMELAEVIPGSLEMGRDQEPGVILE